MTELTYYIGLTSSRDHLKPGSIKTIEDAPSDLYFSIFASYADTESAFIEQLRREQPSSNNNKVRVYTNYEQFIDDEQFDFYLNSLSTLFIEKLIQTLAMGPQAKPKELATVNMSFQYKKSRDILN